MDTICCSTCAKDKQHCEFLSKTGRTLKTCASCREKQKKRDDAYKLSKPPLSKKQTSHSSSTSRDADLVVDPQPQAPFLRERAQFFHHIDQHNVSEQLSSRIGDPKATNALHGLPDKNVNQAPSFGIFNGSAGVPRKAIASALRAQSRLADFATDPQPVAGVGDTLSTASRIFSSP